jgi:cyclopropane fatty-acyl-phospholipid synthase-like methyltransferase
MQGQVLCNACLEFGPKAPLVDLSMDRRKQIVRAGYDAVAEKYAKARRMGPREKRWIDRFLSALPSGARILDLGCGNGEPNLVAMVERGFRVTGVDFSHEQVIRARARCPTARVIENDLSEVEFLPATFDAVLAYDSIFHVPREEHAAIFARIRHWLVDGGLALLTLGFIPESASGELHTGHLGAPTFYAAWPLKTSFDLLHNAGLILLDHDVESNPADSGVEGGHVIVLVRGREELDRLGSPQ